MVVVEVEDSLFGGFTIVVSFLSPGGLTTVVLLSPGGTLTLVSQAVNANVSASAAQRIIDFIIGLLWLACRWPEACRATFVRADAPSRSCNSYARAELHTFECSDAGQCNQTGSPPRSDKWICCVI